MTKHTVCAVKDSAVQAFQQPFFSPAIGASIRAFTDELDRAESPLSKHPDDYELWFIATFDDETSLFTDQDEMRVLARAKDLQRP